jgi:DNA-binding LytR/AlgR family response regulator
MRIRCIAVDDEPPGLNMIKSYIEKTSFLELCGAFSNPVEALNFAKENNVQLALLDINMPDIDGMKLSRLLPENCKVIFITAYEEYALESYRVAALDYLVKPVSYDDFIVAVEKAKDYFKLLGSEIKPNEYFFVKADYKMHQIRFDNVLYFKNVKDYVQIYQKDGSRIMPLISLKNIEAILPDNFMKVHRSFIVNLNEIKTVERSRIVFGKEYIPIADNYKDEFNKFLTGRSII